MADGRDLAPGDTRPAYPWTEIFRCFQVALDPRKLLAAAVGILAMSLGWYLLSYLFTPTRPIPTGPEYTVEAARTDLGAKKSNGQDYTDDEYKKHAADKFQKDLAEFHLRNDLAGEDGRLRTLPWYEYRGPNPYIFATTVLGGSAAERSDIVGDFLSGTVPVLVEPLVKLLIPVVKIADPHANFLTRVYLALCILWSLACWAFFGGVITRIAAVQLTGKDRVSLQQAVKFVADRYLSYLLSPIVPLGIVAAVVVGLALFGMLALIPLAGDFLFYGVGLPLVILGGLVMAILLIGLVGYPLMYATLSVEGSDTFDALSRSYNYVFQAPWQYLWYWLVAVVYGAAVTLFVVFVASLMVYLGKWGVSRALLSETTNQKPDYLFVYAPESFGWKELFLKGSPIAVEAKPRITEDTKRKVVEYVPADPARAEEYKKSYRWFNYAGAGMVTFWLVLVFLLMLGFSYSYFWSAATMIYLLMRKKVDEVETDEVYLEDDADAPLAPPPSVPPTTTDRPGAASLPMVPPPPATVPFAPPAAPVATAPAAATVPPANSTVVSSEPIPVPPGGEVKITADGEVKVTPPANGDGK